MCGQRRSRAAAAALVTSSTRQNRSSSSSSSRTELPPTVVTQSVCGETGEPLRSVNCHGQKPDKPLDDRDIKKQHTSNISRGCLPFFLSFLLLLPYSFCPFTLSSLAPTQWNFNSQAFLFTALLVATVTSSTPLHSRRIRNILIKTYFRFHFSRDLYL